MAGPEVLAEGLGLVVDPGVGGRSLAEQAVDHEVEGVHVGELVAIDREIGRLGDQPAERVDGEGGAEPRPVVGVADPDAHVGVAALVARASVGDQSERAADPSDRFSRRLTDEFVSGDA